MGLTSRMAQRSGLAAGNWLSHQPPTDWVRNAFLAGDPIYAGKSVNEQSAMCVSAVYYCVGLIGESVASLPITVVREPPNGSPVAVDKPQWLIRPNLRMTSIDFWSRVMMSLLLAGNAYIYVLRNSRGDVVELWPVHPSWVYVYPDPDTNEMKYDVNGITLDETEMLHIPALAMPGYLTGLSPLEAARQAIGVAMSAEEFAARFYSQGATMTGVIRHPGKATPEEAKRLKEEFMKRHNGANNAWAVGILTGGAEWQPITITPEQSQFLETRNFTKADIALFYRVPAYRVDPSVTSSWGRGVEEQNYQFVQDTLHPWIARLEQAVSIFLLPGFRNMRFNTDARLRSKMLERFQSNQLAIGSGIKNPDEVRAEEGLPPIPGGAGSKFFRPVSWVGIDEELPKSTTGDLPSLVDGGTMFEPPAEEDPADAQDAGGGEDPNANAG